MATSAEELLVKIEATTESLRRELRRGEDSVGQFKTNVERKLGDLDRIVGGVGSSLRTALGAFGVGLGVSELVGFSRSILKFADNLEDTAGQLQISTQLLQVLRYAAGEAGVEAGTLEGAIAKLTARIGEAAAGEQAATRSFQRLGIGFKDAGGGARETEAVLRDLMDRIAALPDPASRAAAAAELLGEKMGPRLVALLSAGSAALTGWAEDANKANQIMTDETLRRLAEAQRAIERFSNRLTILGGSVLNFFLESADIDEQYGLARQLDRVVGRLEDANEQIKAIRDNAGAEGLSEMDRQYIGDLEREVADLIKRRAEIFGKMWGKPSAHSGRGYVFTPPKDTSTLDFGTGTGGETEAEKAAKKYQQALIDLAAEIDGFTQSGREKALAEWFKKAGNPTDPEQVTQLTILVDQAFRGQIALEGLAASRQADEEAGRDWTRTMEEGRSVMESVRTPLEAYNAEIDRANYLLSQGAISQETFNRVVERAKDGFIAADEDAQRLIDTASRVGEGFVNSFSRIATAGDTAKEALASFLQVLAQIAAEAAGGGIGDWIANILKAGLGTAGGLSGEIDGMIAANPEIFRDGGIMSGRGRVPLRRYSAGGVARTPQLAMFAEGGVPEAYVPVPSGRIPVELRGGGRGRGDLIFNFGDINVSGGTREQNRDAADRTARAVERSMQDFIDRRLLEQQREGGIFWSNSVS